MKHSIFYLIKAAVLTSLIASLPGCGGGSSPDSGFGGFDPDFGRIGEKHDCNEVITPEKVAAFNASQSEYRVMGTGASSYCLSESTINGNTSRIELRGNSHLAVYEKLNYLSLEPGSESNTYILKANVPSPSEAQVRQIFSKMNVSLGSRAPLEAITASQISANSYVNFGSGDLHYTSSRIYRAENGQTFIQLTILADDDELGRILTKQVAAFKAGNLPLYLFGFPRSGMLTQNEIRLKSSGFRDASAISVFRSIVRDTARTQKDKVYTEAVNLVKYWSLSAQEVNSSLPELYTFCQSQWDPPFYNDRQMSALFAQLSYLLAVNPDHPRKKFFEHFGRVESYFASTSDAARMVDQYLAGTGLSQAQFDLMVEVSGILASQFGSQSWSVSKSVVSQTMYDPNSSQNVARIAVLMRKANLLQGSPADIGPVFEKMKLGLNASNIDLYFKAISQFKSQFYASGEEAVKAADQLVLTNRMNAQNQTEYFNFVSWLKNTGYSTFARAMEVLVAVSAKEPLTQSRVVLYQNSFNYLVNTVYLGRDEAMGKAGVYLSQSVFNEDSFLQIKTYTDWLINSIYLNRKDALSKAEDAVLAKNLNPSQLNLLKLAANWLINAVYLNRSEAQVKADSYVALKHLSESSFDEMKPYFNQLRNQGLSNSDALKLAESKYMP